MKVRMLRNLGAELVKELSVKDIDGPMEGQEFDVAEDVAKRLFAADLAEPVGAKAEAVKAKVEAGEVPVTKEKK